MKCGLVRAQNQRKVAWICALCKVYVHWDVYMYKCIHIVVCIVCGLGRALKNRKYYMYTDK